MCHSAWLDAIWLGLNCWPTWPQYIPSSISNPIISSTIVCWTTAKWQRQFRCLYCFNPSQPATSRRRCWNKNQLDQSFQEEERSREAFKSRQIRPKSHRVWLMYPRRKLWQFWTTQVSLVSACWMRNDLGMTFSKWFCQSCKTGSYLQRVEPIYGRTILSGTVFWIRARLKLTVWSRRRFSVLGTRWHLCSVGDYVKSSTQQEENAFYFIRLSDDLNLALLRACKISFCMAMLWDLCVDSAWQNFEKGQKITCLAPNSKNFSDLSQLISAQF